MNRQTHFHVYLFRIPSQDADSHRSNARIVMSTTGSSPFSRLIDTITTIAALEPFWFAAPSAALGGLMGFLGGASLLEGVGLAVLGALVGLVGWGMLHYSERAREENRTNWMAVVLGVYAVVTAPAALTDLPLSWKMAWYVLPVLGGLFLAGRELVITARELRRGPDRVDEPTDLQA